MILPLLVWDLEQDDGGFQATGDLQQWRWGVVSAGPGAGYDGRRAWAVGLTGNYLNDAVDYLVLPSMDLGGVAAPVLSFQHWYAFGDGDAGWVEVNEGASWRRVDPIYGYPAAAGWSGSSAGWQQASVVLPALTSVQVRYVFSADLTGVGAGWFVDGIAVWDGDVTPPRVESLTLLPDSESIGEGFTVSAAVDDDTGVDSATLFWSTDHGEEGSVAMTNTGGGIWTGRLPGQAPDTRVDYYVTASDGANETRWPTAGGASFRVYLPAPLDLTGPEGRVVAFTADLAWSPPVSVHAVEGYEVWSGGALVWSGTATAAKVPLGDGETEFAVRAVYAEGGGDFSEPWAVQAVLPALVGLTPGTGWPGEGLRLEVIGDHALFVQNDVAVELGEGITVESVGVRDVDRFVVQVHLDEAAEPGPRDLLVHLPAGDLELPDAFVVQSEESRPRLVDVEPQSVEQGDSGTLRVRFVGSLAKTPTVSLGEGLVAAVTGVEGDEVLVSWSASASAPLGAHAVRLDDGARIFEGASLEVKDWRPPVLDTCNTGGLTPRLGALAAVLVLLRRRRDAG